MKFTHYFALCLLALSVWTGCKKESPAVPQSEINANIDAPTRVVQDQNTISQLFSVASYAQTLVRVNEVYGLNTDCGTTTTSNMGNTISVNFADDGNSSSNGGLLGCNLGTDLRVFGTLNFEVTDRDTDGQIKDAELRFSNFFINGNTVSLEGSASDKYLEFNKISDPAETAYFLFDITMPLGQHIKIFNSATGAQTEYFPFNFDFSQTPQPVFAKLRINNGTSQGNDLADLLDLLDKEYILKLEKETTAPTGNSSDYWKAVHTDAGLVEEFTLITGGLNTGDENIDGLNFNLNCGHYTDGTLILDKKAPASGCYYKYRKYDFGYEGTTTDTSGDAAPCTDVAGSACDAWALMTEYTEDISSSQTCDLQSFISTGNCGSIETNCGPTCSIVQCF